MRDPIECLAGLRGKESRLAIGLMSGMSRDGLDVALVRLDGLGRRAHVTLMAQRTFPYPTSLRTRIREAATGTTRDVCALDFELAGLWSTNVLSFLEDASVAASEIDVVGSHGQTLDHVPRSAEARAATLQVGCGDVIAERTGVLTVSDFRPRDIAAGGEGAPLVPFADWVLYAREGETVACHNLGSIANVTVVPELLEDVVAFDTGPANALLDGVIRLRTGDERAIDEDGCVSSKGCVDAEVLATMHEASRVWLERPPPKSAGYDDFGPPLATRVVRAHSDVSTEDLARSAVAFTASTLGDAYARHVVPRHPSLRTIHLSGGGAHNPTLVAEIRSEVGALGLEADVLAEAWIDAKEAVAFALLADATARGLPSNVPGATGASHPVVLGKLSLP